MALGVAAAVLGGGACGSARLPSPSYVAQTTDALEPVDYPPPPARVEYVPKAPARGAVWIDGEWTWQGRRWAWKPGRWVTPPANAAFSPWVTTRNDAGILYEAEGRWRDPSGGLLPDPTALAIARVRGGAVVDPAGEEVPAAPNVSPVKPLIAPPGEGRGEGAGPETPSGATPTGSEPKGDGAPSAGEGGTLQMPREGKQVREREAPHEDADSVDVTLDAAMPRSDAMPLAAPADASTTMVVP